MRFLDLANGAVHQYSHKRSVALSVTIERYLDEIGEAVDQVQLLLRDQQVALWHSPAGLKLLPDEHICCHPYQVGISNLACRSPTQHHSRPRSSSSAVMNVLGTVRHTSGWWPQHQQWIMCFKTAVLH